MELCLTISHADIYKSFDPITMYNRIKNGELNEDEWNILYSMFNTSKITLKSNEKEIEKMKAKR